SDIIRGVIVTGDNMCSLSISKKITILMKRVFLQKLLPLFVVGFLWSCDDDFNSTGAEIVGNDNVSITTYTVENIAAYNRVGGPVQSNNMPINGLGVINNPVFGKTVMSFVTQLEFVSGTNPIADIGAA